MTQRIHTLYVPLVFPAGIAPGAGGDYNTLTIALNGQGRPVLRGTSLAGALRHGWQRSLVRDGLPSAEIAEKAKRFFGDVPGNRDDGGAESHLQVRDSVLDIGHSGVDTRMHHLRDRHLGSVADGGLFAIQVCPPGTRTIAAFVLHDDGDSPDDATAFLRRLLGLFRVGITLGGKANRGVGLARLDGDVVYRVYDLSRVEDYAGWLDDDRRWRQVPGVLPQGPSLEADPSPESHRLQIQLTLGIPRGQDLLIGDGQGKEHDIEPQRITAADGRQYWRLPGSSLRGMFRAWMTRLAAREGLPVADSVQRHQERQRRIWTGQLMTADQMNGANLGWCFLPEDERKPDIAETSCSVAALFGTLFRAGRIHVFDAYAPCSASESGQRCAEEQLRRHVAVDALTGGAAEGMLYDNTVLTALPNGQSPRFDVTIIIDNPTSQEAVWLAKTIRALDLGILRIGSSKSSGRLALLAPPRAEGPEAEFVAAIQPAT